MKPTWHLTTGTRIFCYSLGFIIVSLRSLEKSHCITNYRHKWVSWRPASHTRWASITGPDTLISGEEGKSSSLTDFSAPCRLLVTFRSFMWNSRKLLRKTLITWDRMQVFDSIAFLTPLHTGASGDCSGLHQHHLHLWGPWVFRQVNEQSCTLPRTFIPSVSPVSPLPKQDHCDLPATSCFQQLLCASTGR